MSGPARTEILGRIRAALVDNPPPGDIPRAYRQAGAIPADLELFLARVEDYRAGAFRNETSTQVLNRRSIGRIVVPAGFPTAWLPDIDLVHEPVDIPTLDNVAAVITTCRLAIAETGTIVLDSGPGMGPRFLSLVPDYHLVVVRSHDVVAALPDALPLLEPTRPLTWISGPSATSDIELNRVEGVHGPRTLDVLLLD